MVLHTTEFQRLDYVEKNVETYHQFLTEIENSPFSEIDMLEFACISANTSMQSAIDGFIASRDKTDVESIGNSLLFWGVNAPFQKAAYCVGIRNIENYLIPNPEIEDLKVQREYAVPLIKGLGYAKYSFSACLIHPFESDIVCIDTHMYQTYTGIIPNSKNLYGTSKKCIAEYERIESLIRNEAEKLGVPTFLHQWAVWDLQRSITQNKPKETHDFLWVKGRSEFQTVMGGLEIAG